MSVSVVSGGGGLSDIDRATLNSISSNTVSYVSSNIDTADSTDYYFLSFIPGTTKWKIKRLNKTTYVSDYATGDGTIGKKVNELNNPKLVDSGLVIY